MKHYLGAVVLGSLQFVNALLGGHADETPCARAAMARIHGSRFAGASCAVLDKLDFHHERKGEDHCAKALRHLADRRSKKLQELLKGSSS